MNEAISIKHTLPASDAVLHKVRVLKISSTYRHAFRTSAELGYMDTDIDGMI